ncbi:hypothetical protein AK812_SmicGene26606 [Symbiodinium microadriaticum]|uniref:Uncharacterized protein n=1 Tax=Symbiodinium microadriaticum TaxID=2951 RepID=A0A1Q9D963_SYMMI|nr:hypothetical protein AK812_SmicGene26606 [Symbiodinium microadriaticum]
MRAFAASLLELPPGGDDCDAGVAPDLHEAVVLVHWDRRRQAKRRIAKLTMHVSADDEAAAAAFAKQPDAPMPLQATLLHCMGPYGYLSAAAQLELLESYDEALAAAAAQAFADDARAMQFAGPKRALASDSTGTSTRSPPARAMHRTRLQAESS